MNGATLIKVGQVVGAIMACLALFYAARPLVISDAPPWAGKAEVNKALDHAVEKLEAAIMKASDRAAADQIRSSILGTWRDYCAAVKSGNAELAMTHSTTLGDLQATYRGLVGFEYPLRLC